MQSNLPSTTEPAPAPVETAPSGSLLPDGAAAVAEGNSLCATIDEAENVLELIYSNADGIYVRENGGWSPVDTEIEQPTIDDQEWLDVTPDFIAAFDDMIQTDDSISRDAVVDYTAEV